MTKEIYDGMKKMPFNELTDIIAYRYVYEYGEQKAREVIGKVEQSAKIEQHVFQWMVNGFTPSSKDIMSILNTMPYFLFAKGETLCLGALTILNYWNTVANEENTITATQIGVNVIIDSNRVKLKSNNNFFTRLYQEIDNQLKAKKSFWNE
ncbi:hypothetical protein [Mucilaginibacter panaciglaebae]|uniref:Uncharacterized protein n=1 Tax=Mucilaginibacter panaciglaebae TaxID=502331 RepID=A0ABP7WN19_9SPHI